MWGLLSFLAASPLSPGCSPTSLASHILSQVSATSLENPSQENPRVLLHTLSPLGGIPESLPSVRPLPSFYREGNGAGELRPLTLHGGLGWNLVCCFPPHPGLTAVRSWCLHTAGCSKPLEIRVGSFPGGGLIFLHYFHKGQTCDPQIGCG